MDFYLSIQSKKNYKEIAKLCSEAFFDLDFKNIEIKKYTIQHEGDNTMTGYIVSSDSIYNFNINIQTDDDNQDFVEMINEDFGINTNMSMTIDIISKDFFERYKKMIQFTGIILNHVNDVGLTDEYNIPVCAKKDGIVYFNMNQTNEMYSSTKLTKLLNVQFEPMPSNWLLSNYDNGLNQSLGLT